VAGWAWIFIIEGLLTIVGGVAAFWVLPDSPNHSGKWLKEHEVKYLNLLYRKYRGIRIEDQPKVTNPEEKALNRKLKLRTLVSVLTDWQIYLQSLIFMASSVPTYALKFTLPQIMVSSYHSFIAGIRVNIFLGEYGLFFHGCSVAFCSTICGRSYFRHRSG
jgi:hypothetical protein